MGIAEADWGVLLSHVCPAHPLTKKIGLRQQTQEVTRQIVLTPRKATRKGTYRLALLSVGQTLNEGMPRGKWLQRNITAAAMGTPKKPKAKETIGLSQEGSLTADTKCADFKKQRDLFPERNGPLQGKALAELSKEKNSLRSLWKDRLMWSGMARR